MGLFGKKRKQKKLTGAKWSKPKARPGDKVVLRVDVNGKLPNGEDISFETKESDDEISGKVFTNAEKDQFIETVTEEYTDEKKLKRKASKMTDPQPDIP